jgi:hypothetical protein
VVQAIEGSLYLNNTFSMFCLGTIINLKSLLTLDNLYLHYILTASPIFIVICAAGALICVLCYVGNYANLPSLSHANYQQNA